MASPEPKRQRNARGEGSRLKAEIIDAAMRLLDESPGTVLSLRMVAREAGVAAPSIYSQFPDAGAMMGEIVRECWRYMGEAMEAAAEATELSAIGRLEARMRAFVHYAMERPSRYQLLFAMHPFDPRAGDGLPGPLVPAYRSVERSMEEIVAGGGRLPTPDVFASALLVLSVTHGRIALAHLAPYRPGNSADGVTSFVLETLAMLFGQAEGR